MSEQAKRYIEIFEEIENNGDSSLRYWGFDKKYHDVVGIDALQSVVNCFVEEAFPNGVPNLDGKTKYGVVLSIEGCTTDNPAVRTASPYIATFTANEGGSFGHVVDESLESASLTMSIRMGGESLSSSVVTLADDKAYVNIPNVTGIIAIDIVDESEEHVDMNV